MVMDTRNKRIIEALSSMNGETAQYILALADRHLVKSGLPKEEAVKKFLAEIYAFVEQEQIVPNN